MNATSRLFTVESGVNQTRVLVRYYKSVQPAEIGLLMTAGIPQFDLDTSTLYMCLWSLPNILLGLVAPFCCWNTTLCFNISTYAYVLLAAAI